MADTDAARIGDVKAGLVTVKADVDTRLERDGANVEMTPTQADTFRDNIGALDRDGSNVDADAFQVSLGVADLAGTAPAGPYLGFWTNGAAFNDAPNSPRILRQRGRAFFGVAAQENGARTNLQTDWFNSPDDGPDWLPRDADVVSMSSRGSSALAGLSRTSDKAGITAPPSTGGVFGFGITNTSGGFSRGGYFEGQLDAVAGPTGQAWGQEVVVKNKTTTNSATTPYSAAPGAKGVVYVAGGDPTYGGAPSSPANVGISFERGGEAAGYPDLDAYRFNRGVCFGSDAFVRAGGTATGAATVIQMAVGHQINWQSSFGASANIRSDVNTAGANVELVFQNNAVNFYGTGSASIALMTHVSGGVNYLGVDNAITSNPVRLRALGGGTNGGIDLQARLSSGIAALRSGGGARQVQVNDTGVAFNGVAPVARPSIGPAATDLATALTLLNNIRSCLIANGLAVA